MLRKPPQWAVVLDFDGTISPKSNQSVFHLIEKHAGLSPQALREMKEIINRYLPLATSGKLTTTDEINWIFNEVRSWINHGLDPGSVALAMNKAQLRPRVAECLAWLKTRNIPVVIVSYGVRQFIQMILLSKGIANLVDDVYALDLTVDPVTGKYDGFVANSAVIPSNKGMWSRDFARLHRIPYSNILAVGDSWGDWGLGHLKENRLGLATDQDDATALSPYFGKIVVTDSFLPAWQWIKKRMRHG